MKKFLPIACCLFFLFASVVFSQPGSLDPSFGNGGKVTTSIDVGNDFAQSVAIQSDGKIVVVGNKRNGTTDYDFALVRYNSDGTLDINFGSNGIVTTSFGSGNNDMASELAIQTDGKILVVGFTEVGSRSYFALARYNTNGVLDPSFGSNGKVITTLGTISDGAYSIALQNDGKIVVAGFSYQSMKDFAVVRYNTDGTLDSSFGQNGVVTTNFGADHNSGASSVAIQTDGKIVLVGGTNNNGMIRDIALARYNSDGSLDFSFGVSGKQTTSIGSYSDGASSVAIQKDGKIVIAGTSLSNIYTTSLLARYNTNGTLDNSFNSSGYNLFALQGSNNYFYSLVIQPNGKIIAVGSTKDSDLGYFAIVCCKSDGTLDDSFGTSGIQYTNFGGNYDEGSGVTLQQDGKIVAVGQYHSTFNGNNIGDFAVARYMPSQNIGIQNLSNPRDKFKIFPNPFVGNINLKYNLDEDEILTICLYDLSGNKVKEILSSEKRLKGPHLEVINGLLDLCAGDYYITIDIGQNRISIPIIKK